MELNLTGAIKIASNTFWNFLDSRYIIRRMVLFITIWMSYISYLWAASFAATCMKDGTEIALIIGAVLVPISALQGFAFKLYLDSKAE